MQLIEIVQEIFMTGELTMSLERQMQNCLESKELDELELAALDQLIEAICQGTVRAVADVEKHKSYACHQG